MMHRRSVVAQQQYNSLANSFIDDLPLFNFKLKNVAQLKLIFTSIFNWKLFFLQNIANQLRYFIEKMHFNVQKKSKTNKQLLTRNTNKWNKNNFIQFFLSHGRSNSVRFQLTEWYDTVYKWIYVQPLNTDASNVISVAINAVKVHYIVGTQRCGKEWKKKKIIERQSLGSK